MSIEAVSWALSVPVGGNAKVCLLGLANHAHPDGTEAYPSLDTLATYAHCDRSTAKRNVHKLVELGWIREDGRGPRGQVSYRLAMNGRRRAGGQNGSARAGGQNAPGASAVAKGGQMPLQGGAAVPPEPSLEPSSEPPRREERARTRERIPDGFPDELRPHAHKVMELLIEVAKDHNAKEVSSLALGRLMMKQPRKPFVATAYDLSTWAADPPRPIKDVVATYRTFLDRTSPLAATERLDDEGHPWEAPRNGNGNGMNGIRRNPNSQPVGAFREAARQLVAEREGRPV